MRKRVAIAALAIVFVAPTSAAQPKQTDADPSELTIYSPGMRILPGKLPSDEALALGRRLVVVLDGPAIARRTRELVSIAQAYEPPRPAPPTYPNGPIRAVPPVDLANYPDWGFMVQQRVVDHGALAYAYTYGTGELREMAAFFESPAGKAYLNHRKTPWAEVERQVSTPLLEQDLWNVVCGVPVATGPRDAPHHEFDRLHPPVENFPLPPMPKWCAALGVPDPRRRPGR